MQMFPQKEYVNIALEMVIDIKHIRDTYSNNKIPKCSGGKDKLREKW